MLSERVSEWLTNKEWMRLRLGLVVENKINKKKKKESKTRNKAPNLSIG